MMRFCLFTACPSSFTISTMHLPSLLGHSAQMLRLIDHSQRPADVLASEYFRAKKYIGAKERRFISAIVFAALRGRSAFEFCATEALKGIMAEISAVQEQFHQSHKGKKASAEVLFHELGIITACALVGNQVGVGNMFEHIEETLGIAYADLEGRIIVLGEAFASRLGISADAGIQFAMMLHEVWSHLAEEIEHIFATEDFSEAAQDLLATRFAAPRWMLAAWQEGTTGAGDWFSAVELAASMLGAAPVPVRINRLAADRETVLTLLRRDGIHARAGKLSPDAILIDRRVNLTGTNLYREGVIEIQDEASQLAGFGLAPEATWRVLDACAGAGGKALHIGNLQGNRGEIIAADIEYQRLKELPLRAKRSGVSRITTVHLTSKAIVATLPEQLAYLKASCDAVVVDAPCSGIGTVRRMPMTKWRLTPELLRKHAQKQLEIVNSFAGAVKPGGVLLYLTCSLMPQENSHVVDAFLAKNPDFMPEALAPAFAKNDIHIPGLASDAAWLTLTPSQHGTDGFFMARLRKKM